MTLDEFSEAEAEARRVLQAAQPELAEVVDRLTAFSDLTRLELLIAVHAVPGAPVKTLAAATELAPNTVSQALVTLRAGGLVKNTREGRLSRWWLADGAAHDLLHHLGAPHTDLHPATDHRAVGDDESTDEPDPVTPERIG